MRGKNKGWTMEQDRAILSGKKVEGRTSREVADRRYKLKKFYVSSASKVSRDFLKRLEMLRLMGRLPDFVDEKFIDCLKKFNLTKEVLPMPCGGKKTEGKKPTKKK